ncbi:MAG: NAD-dependent epimerase/dehydratase family protein, partial [Phaeodactylibacter sp.]|nr:NAD-dependent epimerase/dehydratase family protein [Phaeodactylibacter sp.]
MKKDRFLITGANGQIGSVLTTTLRSLYGEDRVLPTDIRRADNQEGPFEIVDVLDAQRIAEVIDQYEITQVYHLAAILSARGEQQPLSTWEINMNSLFNILEVAREKKLDKVFFPSSIAVFGPDTRKVLTPQHAVLTPTTVYGIS